MQHSNNGDLTVKIIFFPCSWCWKINVRKLIVRNLLLWKKCSFMLEDVSVGIKKRMS